MVDFTRFFRGVKKEKSHDYANRVRIVGFLRVILPCLKTLRYDVPKGVT